MINKENRGWVIGALGILVSIAAWVFPLSSPSVTYLQFPDMKTTITPDLPKPITTSYNNSAQISRPGETLKPLEEYKPLITEISFSTFFKQIDEEVLESNKLSYIETNKHLLKNNIEFSQLNSILSGFVLGSSKLKAIHLLRGKLNPPNEEEIEVYTSQFVLSSNKKRHFL